VDYVGIAIEIGQGCGIYQGNAGKPIGITYFSKENILRGFEDLLITSLKLRQSYRKDRDSRR
jgi:hypothetical protein